MQAMYRLSLILCTCALLLAACGRVPEMKTGTEMQPETAALHGTTPVAESTNRAMAAAYSAPLDRLPPLPTGDAPLRLPSALHEVAKDGADSFRSNGSNSGTAKLLAATGGSISYAIYQFPGLAATDTLQRLDFDLSAVDLDGAQPGLWFGLADFTANRWATLGQLSDDGERLLSLSDAYISPAGNAYIFCVLTGDQSVTVEQVTLEYDDAATSTWTEVEFAQGHVAQSPSIVVDTYGSPWVAWSNTFDGTARYAWGNALLDLSQAPNWEVGNLDAQPQGRAEWVDITMDPRNDLPVASVTYTEQADGANNSQAGFSVFRIGAQGQRQWFNFTLSRKMDEGHYTTIDFDPVSGFFGMATAVTNANTPGSAPHDMFVRYVDLGVLTDFTDDNISRYTNFGFEAPRHFPHLRFNPEQQRVRVLVNGGILFESTDPPGAADADFVRFDDVANTGPLGSLAYNPADSGPLFAVSYTKDIGGAHTLFYGTYADEEADPDAEVVATLPITGQGEWLGAASQLAFMPDGRPVIAYAVKEGSAVTVRLAYKQGGQWVSETVSSSPSLPGATPQSVLVDVGTEPAELFFPATHRVFVVWNQLGAGSSDLKLAYRTFAP
jgi:hypothetical protein